MTHALLSEQFAEDHAPGSMTLTASRWCLALDVPPELKDDWPDLSRLAYALHLKGTVPLENVSSPVTERGKDMEIVGHRRLERLGFKIIEVEPRITHRSMRALAYPDVIARPPDETGEVLVELKTVDQPDFRNRWNGAPPLAHQLQLQAQMACSGHQRGYVAALVLVWKGLELHLFSCDRDEEIIDALQRKGQAFLDLIASTPPERLAEVLVEEDSPDSYRSWSRAVSLAKDTAATLEHPEAVTRALRLHEARKLNAAYKTIAEAEANWFAVHCPPNAERITLLDGTTIIRQVVKTPEKAIAAYVRPARQHVTLKVKPAGEEAGDG